MVRQMLCLRCLAFVKPFVSPIFIDIIAGSPASILVSKANSWIKPALCLYTNAAYKAKFRVFFTFVVWFQLPLDKLDTILIFLEFVQAMDTDLTHWPVMCQGYAITFRSAPTIA